MHTDPELRSPGLESQEITVAKKGCFLPSPQKRALSTRSVPGAD